MQKGGGVAIDRTNKSGQYDTIRSAMKPTAMPTTHPHGILHPSACLLLLLVLLIGCEATPSASSRLNLALDHYEAKRYQLAQQHAMEAMRSPGTSATDRERAAYLAGLSAFRIGDMNEAELRLNGVLQSSDRILHASAQALLGQIKLDRNRPAEAATHFEAASRGLIGEDARQARRYAAIAHYEAGNLEAAERWYEPPNAAEPIPSRGGFTLQVGAFQDQRRAEQAAAETADVARGHGIGPVTVKPSIDSRGRRLYLVQFGQFPTRQAAAQARSRLGRLDYIVAPISRG